MKKANSEYVTQNDRYSILTISISKCSDLFENVELPLIAFIDVTNCTIF